MGHGILAYHELCWDPDEYHELSVGAELRRPIKAKCTLFSGFTVKLVGVMIGQTCVCIRHPVILAPNQLTIPHSRSTKGLN